MPRGGTRADSGARRNWNVRQALDWTHGYLERKGDEHPRLSAEWLMSAATGLSRVEVYAYFDRPMNRAELDRLHKGIVRRAAGEPLQYVTGEMGFRHIVVRCEPGVLIPRPETEMLVEEVLPYLDAAVGARGEAHVLDIGTGSGCIACSIATERDQVTVVATDLSAAAVSLAERNVAALRLEERVQVIECDLASGLSPEEYGTFDVVVSNPPYIPTAELAKLPHEVEGFEPSLALVGGPDGMAVFRRILACACRAGNVAEGGATCGKVGAVEDVGNSRPALLRAGGLLACELHETCLEAAARLCLEAGMSEVHIIKDLAGRPRDVLAVLPPSAPAIQGT